MQDTGIFGAIRKNDLRAMNELAREMNMLELQDDAGRTPLINAVVAGQSDLLRLLISLGANCNAKDKDGFTALTLRSVELCSIALALDE
jgi:hypothetical protein